MHEANSAVKPEIASRPPLTGVRILDLSSLVSGGTTTSLLADFGAEVIKVEPPGEGDPLRRWGPFKDGVSLWWKVAARNKKAITLDLRRPAGQALLRRLVRRCDVVVENFRPGTLERWSIGPDVLHAENPALVIVRISGFGQTGPYAGRPGFGTIAEAMSGLVAMTGSPDGPPLLPAFPLADEVAGLFGTVATMMALFHRDRHEPRRGQVIDVSLYEPLFRLLIPYYTQYALLGRSPERMGNEFPDAVPRGLYRTKDGQWLAISATSQNLFERLAQAMGQPDLGRDPRFADNGARLRHRDGLNDLIQQWVGAHGLPDALDALTTHGAVAGAVYTMADVARDPHYRARENLITVDDPELGPTPMMGVVPKLAATPGEVRFAGPRVGEHNDEVYRTLLELDGREIEQLAEQRIV